MTVDGAAEPSMPHCSGSGSVALPTSRGTGMVFGVVSVSGALGVLGGLATAGTERGFAGLAGFGRGDSGVPACRAAQSGGSQATAPETAGGLGSAVAWA